LVAAIALAVAGLLCAAPSPAGDAPAARSGTSGPYAAALPEPAVVAQGVSSANPAHLFRDRAWDFTRMREVFNAVALLPGDPAAVTAARQAGLAVVLEFDYKSDFFAGVDISAKVLQVVDQIRANPGTISAVHVADRLNEKYDAAQSLAYLAATGGVLHRLVPGIPVLVNAPDWQLTCGLPGQSSCGSHGDRYQYETNATLDAMYHSGFVDGLSIATNLKNDDPAAQRQAMAAARARWPAPFLLWATCSQLSFPDQHFPGAPDPKQATEAYMLAPISAGAEGIALWAWHQLYAGQISTFLDKDGSSNPMWQAMTTATAAIPGIVSGRHPLELPPVGQVRGPVLAPVPPAGADPLARAGIVVLALALLGVLVRAAVLRRRRGHPRRTLTARSHPEPRSSDVHHIDNTNRVESPTQR
jgi:hypothetical protein